MIIGGEHFFEPAHLLKKSKGYIDYLIREFQIDYYINFTFGGYYSLLAIIDEIKQIFDNDSIVLLPSYMCPSILKPFKLRGISYKFYKVDEDLYIDTDYLISIIDDKIKAVLFIDYFGASQLDRLQSVMEILKSKKIIIIQDVVQCLKIPKNQLFGDYIFNSFRKFFPFEGSILLSKEKMNIRFSVKKNKYISPKRIGQLTRYFHVKYNIFTSNLFLRFFRKAEDKYYVNQILRIPKFNLRQLNKYDIDLLANKQRYYFSRLLNDLGNKIPELLCRNDFIPLGFVIKTDRRNIIRMNLFEKNIFPPIHWILSDEIDKDIFNESIELSNIILTIPLLNMNEIKYDYLIQNIKKYIKK
jgi:hypothetical protein